MSLHPKDVHETAGKVLEQCLRARENDPNRPIQKMVDAEAVANIQHAAIPEDKPASLDSLLDDAERIFQYRTRMDHPRFFGFIPSPITSYSWLGEVLSTAYNTHAGSWYQSSGPSTVEKSLIKWLTQIVGFPETAGGCVVSGGSMANLSALTVARDQNLAFEERSRATIYMSEQTHSSNARDLRILGFRDEHMQKIASDEAFCIDVNKLQATIDEDKAAGKKPFLVIANFGTTNTGSIDPLKEISAIAKKEKLWLHVDGAYGASVALSTKHRYLAKDLQHCDSLTWDAHKWLFQTYACGIVLFKNKRHLTDTFRVSAEYIQDAVEGSEEFPNFWNYGPEWTRPARAMKLWFSLKLIGLNVLGSMIDQGILLAQRAEAELKGLPGWQVLSRAKLGIVCFRFVPEGKSPQEVDALNRQISRRAIELNVAAPLTTQLRGMVCLRICSIHPDLSESDMATIIRRLIEIAKELT